MNKINIFKKIYNKTPILIIIISIKTFQKMIFKKIYNNKWNKKNT